MKVKKDLAANGWKKIGHIERPLKSAVICDSAGDLWTKTMAGGRPPKVK